MRPEEAVDALRSFVLDAVALVAEGEGETLTVRMDHAGVVVSFIIAGEGRAAGRILGKEGRTIKALRSLAHAIGKRHGLHVQVDMERGQ